MGMPLDSSLFNGQIESMAKHVVATRKLPQLVDGEPNPNKYSMGTPDEVWSTMVRVHISDEGVPPWQDVQDIDLIELRAATGR